LQSHSPQGGNDIYGHVRTFDAVGDTSDVLFRLIRENQIDLLVLSTHGRSGFPKLMMGSVAEKIFRQASIPVLTVGPHVPRQQKSVAELNRVLFATDFSDESLAAAPYVISLDQKNKGHLTLLHVLEHPRVGTVDCESNADFIVRRLEELVPIESGLLVRIELRRRVWASRRADIEICRAR
jgi:nucleotide-binding universal stress UspA family protein